MKTISLLSAILVLPAASLLAQGQSEIEMLRTRMDAQDRRISQLENAVIRLGGSPIQKAPAPAAASKTSKTSSSTSMTTEYVVAKGDTLTRIASLHKSSVAAIKKENALKSDGLRIGQKLRIPSAAAVKKQVFSKSETQKAVASTPAPTPKSKPAPKSVIAASDSAKYKVVAGDTFYGIARRYSMSESTLQAANPKAVPTRLQIGQILLVSKDVKPAPVKKSSQVAKKTPVKKASAKSPSTSKSSSQVTTKSSSKTAIRTITVHEQMTYGAFANKYGASTSQLNSLNGLNLSKSTILAKGSELYVPKQY